jgi:hypothetical protein
MQLYYLGTRAIVPCTFRGESKKKLMELGGWGMSFHTSITYLLFYSVFFYAATTKYLLAL